MNGANLRHTIRPVPLYRGDVHGLGLNGTAAGRIACAMGEMSRPLCYHCHIMKTNQPESIDAYIATFPPSLQDRLQAMRAIIAKTAPKASEKISYAMPTFYLNGNLVHFAAFKNHVGLYPGAGGVAEFEAELDAYVHAKGSIQFPHDKPLPTTLIKKIVAFRVKQQEAKAKTTKKAT